MAASKLYKISLQMTIQNWIMMGTTDETSSRIGKPNGNNLKIGSFVLVKVKFGKRDAIIYVYILL